MAMENSPKYIWMIFPAAKPPFGSVISQPRWITGLISSSKNFWVMQSDAAWKPWIFGICSLGFPQISMQIFEFSKWAVSTYGSTAAVKAGSLTKIGSLHLTWLHQVRFFLPESRGFSLHFAGHFGACHAPGVAGPGSPSGLSWASAAPHYWRPGGRLV